MKKFKFSLSTVLSYKQQVLDSLQAEHAAAIAELRKQEDWLSQLQQEYKDFSAEYRQKCSGGMVLREAMGYQVNLRARERELEEEHKKLEALHKTEEAKRQQVVEAKLDTSSLEKLQEKKLGEYNASVAKYEEQFIEEFVSSQRTVSDR